MTRNFQENNPIMVRGFRLVRDGHVFLRTKLAHERALRRLVRQSIFATIWYALMGVKTIFPSWQTHTATTINLSLRLQISNSYSSGFFMC